MFHTSLFMVISRYGNIDGRTINPRPFQLSVFNQCFNSPAGSGSSQSAQFGKLRTGNVRVVLEIIGMKVIMNWFFGMVKFWKGYENKQSSDNPGGKVSGVDKVMEAVRKKPMKKVPDDTFVGLEDYLMSRFCFRFNRLTEETEFKEKNAGSNDYRKVTQRNLNTFCIHARREGIDCWDWDVTCFLYLAGERCWFTSEEEAIIMEHNKTFYKTAVEEEVFYTCFRLPANGEKSVMLRAADIFRHLRKHNPTVMRGKTATNFGKVLMAMGVERVHTRNGNFYPVVFLDD